MRRETDGGAEAENGGSGEAEVENGGNGEVVVEVGTRVAAEMVVEREGDAVEVGARVDVDRARSGEFGVLKTRLDNKRMKVSGRFGPARRRRRGRRSGRTSMLAVSWWRTLQTSVRSLTTTTSNHQHRRPTRRRRNTRPRSARRSTAERVNGSQRRNAVAAATRPKRPLNHQLEHFLDQDNST